MVLREEPKRARRRPGSQSKETSDCEPRLVKTFDMKIVSWFAKIHIFEVLSTEYLNPRIVLLH